MTRSPRRTTELALRVVVDVLTACAFAVVGALWLAWLQVASTQGPPSLGAALGGLSGTGFELPLLVLIVPTVLAHQRRAGRA